MTTPITLHLPSAIEEALTIHCKRSGDTFEHVIFRALSDFLDLEHHSLYQISTSGALVEGVFQGCMRVREILKQGDFGLGTFHGLDGEGIMVDGACYQALSDGSVLPADPDYLTHFGSPRTLSRILKQRLNPLRTGVISVDSWIGFVHQIICLQRFGSMGLLPGCIIEWLVNRSLALIWFQPLNIRLSMPSRRLREHWWAFLPRTLRIRLVSPATICISLVATGPMVGMC